MQVERRLQWKGLPVAVMPLRLTEGEQLVRPVRHPHPQSSGPRGVRRAP